MNILHLQAHPYSAALLIAAVIAAADAVIIWRRRSAPGAVPLTAINAAAAVWTLTYAAMWASTGLNIQIFWLNATYLGAAVIPTAYLIFVLQFSEHAGWMTRRRFILLGIEPVLTFLFVWTNPLHHLFHASFSEGQSGPFAVLNWERGIWFWINICYSYALLLVAFILLLRLFFRLSGRYRWQAGMILFGSCIPWAASIYSQSGLSAFGNLDLTPISFSLMGLVFGYALLRYRLLRLIPIARSLIIEKMSDSVVVLDDQDRVVDLNPSARELTEFQGSFIGKTGADVFAAWPDMVAVYQGIYSAHSEFKVSENPECYVDLQIDRIHNGHNHYLGRVIILRDVTARKRAQEGLQRAHEDLQHQYAEINELQTLLREQALRDPLTGLHNRRFMEEVLDKELATAAREGYPVSTTMLDIDNFKLVNDTFGHEAGDVVLKALATLLLAGTRKTDIVCRYGGEEFVVVMPRAMPEITHDRVEEWRMKFEETEIPYQNVILKCTFSAGVASYPQYGMTVQTLLNAAEESLYAAKQEGRNRVAIPKS